MCCSIISDISKRTSTVSNVTVRLRPWTGSRKNNLRWDFALHAIVRKRPTSIVGWHVTAKDSSFAAWIVRRITVVYSENDENLFKNLIFRFWFPILALYIRVAKIVKLRQLPSNSDNFLTRSSYKAFSQNGKMSLKTSFEIAYRVPLTNNE